MNKIMNWTNLLTVMFLAMVALPTDVWADTKQTYIKKVTIASRGSSKDAINDLTNAGYQIMPKDLNASAGGDYIYLGYITTEDPDSAITDLIIMDGNSFGYSAGSTKSRTIGKYTYHPVAPVTSNYDGDLNKKAGGHDLYLWYSNSEPSAGVITAIGNISNKKNTSLNYVQRSDGTKTLGPCDANESAGGDYIYLTMTKKIPLSNTVPAAVPYFKVRSLGGGLFMLDLPFAVKDEKGKSWIMGGKNYAYAITYQAKGSDKWTPISVFSGVWPEDETASNKFEVPWTWKFSDAVAGTFINPKTFSKLERGTYHIDGGNNYDAKVQSLLWAAPDNDEIESFKITAYGYTNFETSNATIVGAEIITSPTQPQTPTDQNLISVTGPVINAQVSNEELGDIDPGQQLVTGYGANSMISSALWDPQSKTFKYKNTETEHQGFSFNVDASDELRDYVAVMYGDYKSISLEGKNSTTQQAYAIPISVKPFHAIQSMSVTSEHKLNAEGKLEQENTITWTVDNIRDNDVLENDVYLIQRSYDSQFAYPENITQISVASTTENDILKITTKDNQKHIGTYTVKDTDEAGWANPEQKGDNRVVYYRVVRAFVSGIWEPQDFKDFAKTDSLKLDNRLVTVEKVSLEKLPSFDYDKLVKVKVHLGGTGNMWDKRANIKIQRKRGTGPNGTATISGTDYAAKEITIKGEDVKYDKDTKKFYAEVTDAQPLPYIYYYYTASVDTTKTAYPAVANTPVSSSQEDAIACYSESLALITDFSASRGTLKGHVVVEWAADDGLIDEYKLERYEYPNGKEFTPLTLDSKLSTTYIDTNAETGKVYGYRLTASCTVEGRTYTSTKTTYGWNPYTAKLSNTFKLKNGASMPGKITVTVRSTDAVTRPAVKDVAPNDTVIVPAFSGRYERTVTTTDGTAVFDDLPYLSKGSSYTIKVSANGANFSINGQDNVNEFTTTIDDKTYDQALNFVCKNTVQFSGRVLYSNSTIPVRDCEFLMNGSPVLDGSGNAIKTDSKGNYSFLLPAIDMTVQAAKDGHTFEDGGYILGKNSDQLKPISTLPAGLPAGAYFHPTGSYDEVILSDATTIRLVGRIAGGDIQGCKPLGFGTSVNNLGDNLKIVMELEGDNTAQIVYDRENPDNTTRRAEFTQTVSNRSNSTTLKTIPTTVQFEKKRIVVTPDVNTGEFCLDLAPTKYKITELSADGYPTLFNNSEGFQVIDLSNDLDIINETTDVRDGNHLNTLATSYNSTYKRIYHSPVSVTYQQTQTDVNINPYDYYGEETLTEYCLTEDQLSLKAVNVDKVTKQAHYVFGYPVFENGNRYSFRVSAHEDYYYNNNKIGTADIVPINGGLLRVKNGLQDAVNSSTYNIDSNGEAFVTITVSNTTFNLKDEDALRSLNMEVEVDGFAYSAEPLHAFVTGVKDRGQEIATIDGGLTVVDVIRDPYGSRSYAYREAGTKYHWETTMSIMGSSTLTTSMSIGESSSFFSGVWAGLGTGAFTGFNTSTSSFTTIEIPIPLFSAGKYKAASYDMTLNTRIETSSNSFDVGADADVFIGTVNSIKIGKVDRLSIIDQFTYDMIRPAREAGTAKIIKEGIDSNGKKFYLAITEKLTPSELIARDFVYSQKHIKNIIIPGLIQQYKSAILTGSQQEVQNIANKTKKIQYRLKDGKTLADDECFEAIYPKDANGNTLHDAAQNDVNPFSCLDMVQAWVNVLVDNEFHKIEAINTGKPYKRFSVSSRNKISHTESASMYEKDKTIGSIANYSFADKEWLGSFGLGADMNFNPYKKKTNKDQTATPGGGNDILGTEENQKLTTSVTIPGFTFSLNLIPDISFDISRNNDTRKVHTAGSGFVIETNDDGYLDVDVYQANPYCTAEYVFSDDNWNFVTTGRTDSEDIDMAKVHDFVFTTVGGAERNPWHEPDSTQFYLKGMPLTARTLKIDNPKLYIDKPVVSNLPADETAYFALRITNETDLTYDQKPDAPSSFVLFLEGDSSPGAIVEIDGGPVTSRIPIMLNPGNSITKIISVKRGSKDYDYDNIKIGIRDEALSMFDFATFSVHYLPSSTPVNIVRPADKWVMNTLAAQDDMGRYYMPVEVNGFDVNYENFDHIELQYKKQTEGDSKWVNLCSYYADDSLYQVASGEKQMITSGTINYRFYGEMDPIDIAYDLRAVSFCRLGSGFVTKESAVVSGLKDTRIPEVFGKPQPSNGILTYEDVISIPFNEPIAYNYLDQTANFRIMGFTNNSMKTYNQSLRFPAGKNILKLNFETPDGNKVLEEYANVLSGEDIEWFTVPVSKVKRNLTGRDFTMEAMVKMDDDESTALFATICDDSKITDSTAEKYLLFGISNGKLMATFDGFRYFSEPIKGGRYKDDNLNLTSAMTQVAMTYKQNKNVEPGEHQVRFYVNGVEILLDKVLDWNGKELSKTELHACGANGEISIGCMLEGNMADVRLWNKALSLSELNSKRGKILSGSEPSLLGYWPMDEVHGSVLYDKANGADMHFLRQTWQMPDGQHSLRMADEPIDLMNAEEFLRYDFDDFTLSMWLQPDKDIDVARTGGVTVFQSGADLNAGKFRVFIDSEGMKLQSADRTFSFCDTKNLLDEKWHHFVIVANKTLNTAAMYFDGDQVQLLSGTDIKGLQSQATLGGKGFRGNIDNLTFWHLAFPANNHDLIQNASPTGYEMGLVYYLPFERDESNSQGTIQSVFSPYNEVKRFKEDGTLAASTLAIAPKSNGYAAYDNTKSFPAIKTLTGLSNLPFSWTSTNNELQININKNDAEINHQQIFVTVRGVEDIAGNSMRSPLMMTMYVDRNVLVWDKKNMEVEIPYGKGATVRAYWHNKSGRIINYSIENNDSWLKLSNTMGNAQPLTEEYVDIDIPDGLAPGNYAATVYLIDDQQLSSPISLHVNVMASEPDTEVVNDPSYHYSMNVMGRIKIKNEGGMEYFDMDERDIVFAMYNNVCIGKAKVSADNERGSSMVNMTVYGNDHMIEEAAAGKNGVSFILWRASTNETSILLCNDEQAMPFINNGMVGCPPDAPVIFTLNNDYKHIVPLEKGWNWISFNVIPKKEKGLNQLFESNAVFTPGDRIIFNGKTAEIITDSLGHLSWSGNHDEVSNRDKTVYQLYVQNPSYATVFGSAYDDANRCVTLKASTAADGKGMWNDLPYLLAVDQPINIAMSDFAKDKADIGSVIKSRKQFAVMDGNGEWIGSLQYMHPGEGYYLRYLGKENADVLFTNTQSAATMAAKSRAYSIPVTSAPDDTDDLTLRQGGNHASSMPVIAQLGESMSLEHGDVLVAYCDGELSGAAEATVLNDGRALFFISLNAETGNIVRFAVVRNGKVMAKSSNAVHYDATGIAGSLNAPFVIDFSSAAQQGIYTIDGIKMTEEMIQSRNGIFIINGEKRAKF